MFITLKRHSEVVRELKEQLLQARDLKVAIEMIASKTGIPTPDKDKKGNLTVNRDFSFAWVDATMNFPDTVAQYVPDHFGGKVIKQEATKVVILTAEGNISYGHTKRKADKGYSYLLVRL